MAWTSLEASEYIKSMLGYPKRKIELDHTNIESALKGAIEYYARFRPTLRWDFVQVQAGVSKYDLKALNKGYGRGLLRGFQEPITSPQAVFNEFEYYRLRQPPYVDMAELVVDKMYYKEVGLLTGTEFDWEWMQNETTLLLTPIPTRSFKFAYEYAAIPADVSEVVDWGQTWIVNYALALTKQMLGRVRGKFKGAQGNEGLPLEMDGPELLQEGKQEQKDLEEELYKSRGDWVPPIKG